MTRALASATDERINGDPGRMMLVADNEASPGSLRELVDLALKRHQTSYLTDLERIAKSANYKVVHTTLTQIRKGTYHSVPSKRTLEALAYLAGVSYETAHEAAGLGTPQPSFADMLPRHVDMLSPRQREAVLGVIRSFIDQNFEMAERIAELEKGNDSTLL